MVTRIESLFTEKVNQITNLKPFNHGTTSIKYDTVSNEKFEVLTHIIYGGWSIQPTSFKQVREEIFYSNNYKVTGLDGITYLLKHSNNNAQTQPWVDKATIYCQTQGIPASHILQTVDGNTFLVHDGLVYRVDEFIEGEHYDGSRDELIDVASQLPNFFHILENLPPNLRDSIEQDKRTLIHHDWNQLEALINDQLSQGDKSLVEEEEIQLIRRFSQLISASAEKFTSVPIQVIHRDLHPHNLLFDPDDHHLLAFLDLDALMISQRIRGIAFAMHRLARTYGNDTERKQDLGSDIRDRMRLFLNIYQKSGGELTQDEVELIPYVLLDHTLYAITQIFLHAREGNKEWPKDLRKQIELLREIESIFVI